MDTKTIIRIKRKDVQSTRMDRREHQIKCEQYALAVSRAPKFYINQNKGIML